MDAIILNLKDKKGEVVKSFSKTDINAGLADKILEIEEDIENSKDTGLSSASIKGYYTKIKAILVEIYDNQFTLDALNNGCSYKELKECYHKWFKHIIKN